MLAATVDDANGAILNIARAEETAILDLAYMIKEMTTSSSEVVLVPYEQEYGDHFEDTRRRVPDVGQAEQIVGFRAQVSLAEGLEQTINWFRSER